MGKNQSYYKGFTIMVAGMRVKVIGPIRRKYYPTVGAAKKAIDAWEHKQFTRDKPRAWR